MFEFADFQGFSIARLPRIIFGSGKMREIAEQTAHYGKRVLLITGARSLEQSKYWNNLQHDFQAAGLEYTQVKITGEPGPQQIDQIVAQFFSADIEVVLGIGGGSVLDAAKAVAGLLPSGTSVLEYLEGVGPERPYQPPARPFIAVPTTAGTGSEATKNAVLSQSGNNGFKKSFRHDALVAEVAIIDPDWLKSCPTDLIAADGMDAFTQLLESYVSTRANPLTDALALSGMMAFRDSFFHIWQGQGSAEDYARLAYASLLSGICLAQTGLGSVHGLASPLGAFFPIPHGVVCGTLLAEATDINITALQSRQADSLALKKYTQIGHLLARDETLATTIAQQNLVQRLRDWTAQLQLPRLSAYQMQESDIARVVANSRGSSMKTNPVLLTDAEIATLLQRRL
ncbi:iron-containing alcohol dehydrogenase [Candidatus Venteria ishoeyi]|uniref:iron-containing alcohol dehydrogenase n=1 Tax=Candidatus Venteria ishoeyi TaxID=1899563 RepID=UPI0025A63FCB|nr:iron-containing alcohol dehydrogenase [Candidatus Venteria ishoeyi]MDM8545403.1 iron-containing alcohol dehydrogenase [Candidatus Venteria ishoeyi]